MLHLIHGQCWKHCKVRLKVIGRVAFVSNYQTVKSKGKKLYNHLSKNLRTRSTTIEAVLAREAVVTLVT